MPQKYKFEPMKNTQTLSSSFYVLVVIFFFWGFVAASNGIFIPFCKTHFELNQLESQLIDTSFYGAYFLGALSIYLFSEYRGFDLLNKIGYKKGIIYGLCVSILGALGLATLAVLNINSYPLVLGAFFLIALGFSLQQTSAQPLAIALGSPETGAHRLSFAGSINSLGTLIGPLVVSWLLFGNIEEDKANTTLSSIKTLYIALAVLFTVAIIIFSASKIQTQPIEKAVEKSPNATRILLQITSLLGVTILLSIYSDISSIILIISMLFIVFTLLIKAYFASKTQPIGWGAMQYPQLLFGMLAIFVYVGVEVSIQSNMSALLQLPNFGALNNSEISAYISLYWGGLMIGRWIGAISIFNLSSRYKNTLSIIVPFVAFGIFLLINLIKGNNVTNLLNYTFLIPFLIIASFLGQEKPIKTLGFLSIFGTIAMIIGILSSGQIALYAILSGGLFCSMMWPCIFAIAITNLGIYTSQGAAFLIMMILGGALIPPLQGALIDISWIGAQASYIVPAIGFALIGFYALFTKQVLKGL